MQRATATAQRTIAVLSSAYLESAYGEAEWRAVFANDPTGERGLLVPVRVEEVQPPGLLRTRVYIDLVGVSGQTARTRLLEGGPPGRACPTGSRASRAPGQPAGRAGRSRASPGSAPRSPTCPRATPTSSAGASCSRLEEDCGGGPTSR